ncbi:hypothetical protein FRB99_004964 [Tulasnella sp. 403]|nr:hypothetical protein FRB99_004964 [Tulasnella sp. 403]
MAFIQVSSAISNTELKAKIYKGLRPRLLEHVNGRPDIIPGIESFRLMVGKAQELERPESDGKPILDQFAYERKPHWGVRKLKRFTKDTTPYLAMTDLAYQEWMNNLDHEAERVQMFKKGEKRKVEVIEIKEEPDDSSRNKRRRQDDVRVTRDRVDPPAASTSQRQSPASLVASNSAFSPWPHPVSSVVVVYSSYRSSLSSTK